MTTIVHISGDYPDTFQSRKTNAIKNLVEGTPQFRHVVYSINRLDGFGAVQVVRDHGDVVSLTYRAPPYGILLETCLKQVANWIATDVRRRGASPNLVHGHKLTIEGFAARDVARQLGAIPFICTVRGNTDQKYFRARPDKRGAFRRLAQDAAALLPVTPWIARDLTRRAFVDHDAELQLLPTISRSYAYKPPTPGNGRLVTVFHLASWRLKGIPNLLGALAKIRKNGVEAELDIIGGGDEKSTQALQGLIEKTGLNDCVRLVGPVAPQDMQETLNDYSAFVLPTLRETFGMVYLEALFACLPILYSKDRGVDGFFDGLDIGARIDPRSVDGIASGLCDMLSGSQRMKTAIANEQASGAFDRFTPEAVCQSYADKVCELVSGVSSTRDRLGGAAFPHAVMSDAVAEART